MSLAFFSDLISIYQTTAKTSDFDEIKNHHQLTKASLAFPLEDLIQPETSNKSNRTKSKSKKKSQRRFFMGTRRFKFNQNRPHRIRKRNRKEKEIPEKKVEENRLGLQADAVRMERRVHSSLSVNIFSTKTNLTFRVPFHHQAMLKTGSTGSLFGPRLSKGRGNRVRHKF